MNKIGLQRNNKSNAYLEDSSLNSIPNDLEYKNLMRTSTTSGENSLEKSNSFCPSLDKKWRGYLCSKWFHLPSSIFRLRYLDWLALVLSITNSTPPLQTILMKLSHIFLSSFLFFYFSFSILISFHISFLLFISFHFISFLFYIQFQNHKSQIIIRIIQLNIILTNINV